MTFSSLYQGYPRFLLSTWQILLVLVLAGCMQTQPSSYQTEQAKQPLVNQSNSFWSHRFGVTRDIAYGKYPRQRLDIYRQGEWQGPPKYFVNTTEAKPTLIYIHGGAWHGGEKEASLWSIMPYIQQGWHVVNIEYRVGGNTAPNAADDVLLAMQWLAKHANEYGIDRNNIVVSGDSAGGHLALLAGLINKTPSHDKYVGDKLNVKAIVNWFGITDIAALSDYFEKRNGWNYPKKWAGDYDTFEHIVKHYSPIHYVSDNAPAVLTIHGDADKVVPIAQAQSLHKKLTAHNIDNKLVSLPQGRHLGFSDEQFQTIWQEIFQFLDSKVSQ